MRCLIIAHLTIFANRCVKTREQQRNIAKNAAARTGCITPAGFFLKLEVLADSVRCERQPGTE